MHEFLHSLPQQTMLTASVPARGSTGRWGLVDGLPATSRKEPDRLDSRALGKVPIDRLADFAPACRSSRARIVDAGRMITTGGITSGMEMGLHLLRRTGYARSSSRRWHG